MARSPPVSMTIPARLNAETPIPDFPYLIREKVVQARSPPVSTSGPGPLPPAHPGFPGLIPE